MSLVQLNEFTVIKLTGEDAFSFLQGQVTCDVNKLKETDFVPGCHCNAKGKMWSTFIAFTKDDDIRLVLTKESAEATLRELSKYGVFAKVEISDDTNNWHLYGATESVEQAICLELAEDHYLLLSQSKLSSSENLSSTQWWHSEILSGRAHLFSNTIEEYVPQMLNMQALDYISFNKGCYMGQEMVARMRYLGKNKRALYLASTSSSVELSPGDDVAIELNGNKRNIGKVINSVAENNSTVAQLVLPKDTELGQAVFVGEAKNIALQLQALPYELEDNA